MDDKLVNSVIGDNNDLICIECKTAKKIRFSAYCVECKGKIDPHFKSKHPELYKEV